MRYAIDRYSVGAETEVNASDFDGQYIPSRRNRFYCPECGEIVYFRASGGSHPCQFYHQEKTDRTPECDKRVDGRSDLSLSQRVGLPLYLIRTMSDQFQLNIGFPALGQEMLRKAASAGYSVEISCGDQVRTVKLDHTNFIEDYVTLIPVNFIPDHGKNYSITISGESAVFGLRRKWADYADGFERDGAIFTYEESGGRKIRRGDSISTGRSYYAVIRNILPSYPEIHQSEIGSIRLGSNTYRVIKMEIVASVDDKAVFSTISLYLYRHFGIWLLECQPELVPLWPPVIQRDVYSPLFPQANVVCGVSSSNKIPNIFVYSDYGVNQKKIDHMSGSIWMVEVPVGKRPVTLSVDRKYVGREMTFSYTETIDNTYFCEADLLDNEGNVVDWKTIDTKILSEDFSILSNSKMELYTGTRDRRFRHVSIRAATTKVSARENTYELYLTNGARILWYILLSAEAKADNNFDSVATQIRNSCRNRMVPVPVWADAMIRQFKIKHFQTLYESVMGTIVNGNIPVDVLKLLRIIELEKQDALNLVSD